MIPSVVRTPKREPITLTINGVDGFKSGMWNLHANAVAVDDETLLVNINGVNNWSFIKYDVLPNTPYVFQCQHNGGVGVWDETNSSWLVNGQTYSPLQIQNFVTRSNQTKVSFWLNNPVGITTGQMTFKKPMLNLGSIPAPYDKKRGERMVFPVPKKNLFNGKVMPDYAYGSTLFNNEVLTVSGDWYSCYKIKVKPMTNYYVSGMAESTVHNRVSIWGNVGGSLGVKSDVLNSYFNSGAYSEVYIAFYSGNDTGAGVSKYTNMQIVEGTIAQSYEPYAVQVNKKPFR